MQPSFSAEPYGRPGVVRVTRARSWLVALIAFLVMLVVVGGVGNPPVTRDLLRHTANAGPFKIGMLQAATALSWHFGDGGDYAFRAGWAGVLRAVAVLVLVFLLVAVVARGRGTFWQLLFGTWACVVVAVLLGSYVYSAIFNARAAGVSTDTRGTYVLFGQTTAGAPVLLAGLACGLVTGLIAAAVGAGSRQARWLADAAAGAPYPTQPEQPQSYDQPPQWGQSQWDAPAPYAQPRPFESTPYQDRAGFDQPPPEQPGHTAVLPSVTPPRQPPWSRDPDAQDVQHTTQLPSTGAPQQPPEAGDTQQFPQQPGP